MLVYQQDLGIPKFTDFLQAVHRVSYNLNKTVGIIPELKHFSFHNENRTDPRFMENTFLSTLFDHGYKLLPEDQNNNQECIAMINNEEKFIQCPRVIIQNFDKSALEYIRSKTDLEIMMVVHPELELLTMWGIDQIAKIAQYYCVWKEYLYSGVEKELEYTGKEWDEQVIGNLGGFITNFTQEAHSRGLKMALFTIGDSREVSPWSCASGCKPANKTEEFYFNFQLGLDAMFVENIAESREIVFLYELAN